MKAIFRITATLNLLLVVTAFICAVMAAINKDVGFLVVSAVTTFVSIFPTTLMLALCNDFKEVK